MAASVEYNGHLLTPATRYRRKPEGWTLEVHIKPLGRVAGGRRCRAPNVYATQERATERCLVFGQRIVDGKMHPRTKKS
jgi:hypothetical protein